MLPFLINISEDLIFEKNVFRQADGVILTGLYGNLCQPTSVWHNGATYVAGYKGDATNTSVILKYKNGVVEFSEVGTPQNTDNLIHQFPSILIIDNYIYVFQVNGHGKAINIYKSNQPESVTDGFSLHHRTVYENFGYCIPRLLGDGRVVIASRITSSATNLYGQILAISGVNDLTTWNVKTITDPLFSTTSHRHYPAIPFYYGENTWFYGGIQLRDEPSRFFGQAMWRTMDFATFHNVTGTFSKNIDIDGIITVAELEDNFMIAGSTTSDGSYSGGINAVIVDDVVYNNFFDSVSGVWKMMKIDNGVVSTYPAPFPNMNNNPGGASITTIMPVYNGGNLVFLVYGMTARSIYTCDLNFENIQFRETVNIYGEEEGVDRGVIPYNLNEIEGEYIIGGSAFSDIFPYYITDNKFYN